MCGYNILLVNCVAGAVVDLHEHIHDRSDSILSMVAKKGNALKEIHILILLSQLTFAKNFGVVLLRKNRQIASG